MHQARDRERGVHPPVVDLLKQQIEREERTVTDDRGSSVHVGRICEQCPTLMTDIAENKVLLSEIKANLNRMEASVNAKFDDLYNRINDQRVKAAVQDAEVRHLAARVATEKAIEVTEREAKGKVLTHGSIAALVSAIVSGIVLGIKAALGK